LLYQLSYRLSVSEGAEAITSSDRGQPAFPRESITNSTSLKLSPSTGDIPVNVESSE